MTRKLASDQAPAPDADDLLNPARIVRERVLQSPGQRLGDSTPEGPLISPPVDPDDVA